MFLLTHQVWTEEELTAIPDITKRKNDLWEKCGMKTVSRREGFKKGEILYMLNTLDTHTNDPSI